MNFIQEDPSDISVYLVREVDRATNLTRNGLETFHKNTAAHLAHWVGQAGHSALQQEKLSDLTLAFNNLADHLRDAPITALAKSAELKLTAKKAIQEFVDAFS